MQSNLLSSHDVLPRRGAMRRALAVSLVMTAALSLSGTALGQSRQERGGVVLYWGLVPAAVLAERHPAEQLHGGTPRGGGQVHHLVVAVFDAASGRRIEDAVLRAQLSEPGIVDERPKYLTPMPVQGHMSYGQVFGMAKEGPYRFRIWVKVPNQPDEIEFAITAWSPHRPAG